ncbi:MAG: hypothetical protein WCO56_01350 [Verrucomicrobiota bacterium]
MFERRKTKHPASVQSAPAQVETATPGFLTDLRAVLIPERKWHYAFHGVVILTALAYWIGSFVRWPEASWAEIIMYRHQGDNQVWPVITALSQLNFGDPADVVNHGKGIAGTQVVILLPNALAYAVFGEAGYMVADVLLSLVYFLSVVLLLRQCRFGKFSSLLLGTLLATGALQALCGKLGGSLAELVKLFNTTAMEWSFPALLDLHIFAKRIPRPMGTEPFVVLALYWMVRQWHELHLPSVKQGIAVGALLVLLVQGDPYSVSALGLLLLGVLTRTMLANHGRGPWRFLGGAMLGALLFGWYFLMQRYFESPDSALRIGMATYSRSKLWLLPGYAPWLRLGVVCLLASCVIWAARTLIHRTKVTGEDRDQPGSGTPTDHRKPAEGDAGSTPLPTTMENYQAERDLALFCLSMVVAAWLAQPVQLFLLGTSTQIYHYLIATLPLFYSYALLILAGRLVTVCTPRELAGWLDRFGHAPGGPGACVVGAMLAMTVLLGSESALAAVGFTKLSRQETVVPWADSGNRYRENFRALDREFRVNPELQRTRSFATFCNEVYFLLTAFHDKRTFLPDNAYSTLSDAELEHRLCEVLKIFSLSPECFGAFIEQNHVMNYWLGCAKYWCTMDYKFSREEDYSTAALEVVKKMPSQSPFLLVMPRSENERLVNKYASILYNETKIADCPDVFILTIQELKSGLIPTTNMYQLAYSNEIFLAYTRVIHEGTYRARPPKP